MTENKANGSLDGGAGVDAQLSLVGALAAENAELVARLRRAQIPHHVGMAAAGRALSIDLPRVMLAQIQTELSSGALAQRWDAAVKRASVGEAPPEDAPLAAVAALLVEQVQKAVRYLAGRGEEWASDAYRLEGQANALEEQVERLARARDGIAKSRQQGEAMAERQDQRRQEREEGLRPRNEGQDEHDA